MGDAGIGTPDIPFNQIVDWDKQDIVSANSPELLIDATTETEEFIVRAHPNNSGIIFIGYDEDTTDEKGFPLSAGDAFGIALDNARVPIYYAGDTVGDELRYQAI